MVVKEPRACRAVASRVLLHSAGQLPARDSRLETRHQTLAVKSSRLCSLVGAFGMRLAQVGKKASL